MHYSGTLALVESLTVTISGDNIESTAPIFENINISSLIDGKFAVDVSLPSVGANYKIVVNVFNVSGRTIGFAAKELTQWDRKSALINVPAFSATNAFPTVVLRGDTTLTIKDSVFLRATVADSFNAMGPRANVQNTTELDYAWHIETETGFSTIKALDTYAVMPNHADKEYMAYFTVTDNDGNAISDTVRFDVLLDEPRISVPNVLNGQKGHPVTFSLTADDTYGTIVQYKVDVDGDGTWDRISTDNVLTHTYTKSGNYTAISSVVDDDGNIAQATSIVQIAQHAPVFDAVSNDTTVSIKDSVSFLARATDADGTILAYNWDFDGNGDIDHSGPKANVKTAYAQPGTYVVHVFAMTAIAQSFQSRSAFTVVLDIPVITPNNDTISQFGVPMDLSAVLHSNLVTLPIIPGI